MNDIKQILSKRMPSTCADHHMQMVGANMPINEWYAADNYKPFYGMFDICREWADIGLMAKRITPIWNNGSYQGTKIEFMFNPELKYQCQP